VKRREFITLLGSAAAAWPLSAHAQQAAMPVIGFLDSGSPEGMTANLAAFHKGLLETGYVAGKNVFIAHQAADGRYDQLAVLAADLISQNIAILVGSGPRAALAVKAATGTIPILFVIGYDPVQYGLVSSINRPGGNVTGATFFTGPLGPKRLDLLNQLVPDLIKIGVLINPNSPTSEAQVRDVEAAARTLGREIHVQRAATDADLEKAFLAFVEDGTRAVMLGGDAFFMSQRESLIALAARHQLPVIYDRREYAEVGGLLSYGTSLVEAYHKIGLYAGRILNGEKPADLPVQQATKVELVINLKTAKALGLNVPDRLLALADEVIEQ
jgi:putative ABC transport system substrate-binding protein